MIKSTGIIRRVDDLGRIVIPVEIRLKFRIKEKDPIEIFTDGDFILFKKYEPNCIFCGATKKLIVYNDKLICTKCAEKINKLAEEKK